MPRKRTHFETVRRIGLSLPGVEAGTAYGSSALKLRGSLVACIASHKSAEADTLVVCVGFDERAQLIAADPDTYYLKEHYVNYPVVLVRLSRIHHDALRDLLRLAWRFVDAKARGRRRRAGSAKADVTAPADAAGQRRGGSPQAVRRKKATRYVGNSSRSRGG